MAFEYLAEYTTFSSLEEMDHNVEQHISIHRLDLTASERAIVFALAGRSLMYPGVSHLKAETIANIVGVSTKTVYRSIKTLADLKIIEKVPQPKLNGIKGASIYRILPFENNVPSDVSQRVTSDEASNDNGLTADSENLSIKSFNHLSSKQANNIYVIEDELAQQDENKKTYMNKWQVMLYDFLHSYPMRDELKEELHKVVLATDVSDNQTFHKAKRVFLNLLMDIHNGTITVATTLRAVFAGAYKKIKAYEPVSTIVSNQDEIPVKRVSFYNWLEERESYAQVVNDHRPLENWLEW